jgi:hypothetical protein
VVEGVIGRNLMMKESAVDILPLAVAETGALHHIRD